MTTSENQIKIMDIGLADRPRLIIIYSNTFSIAKENSNIPEPLVLPETIVLHSIYPNPFNLENRIDFSLHIDLPVQITIYNIRGQRIRTLTDEVQPAGYKTAVWDGRDDTDNVVSSGFILLKQVSLFGKIHLP